jgi:uncharacterized protein YkwD
MKKLTVIVLIVLGLGMTACKKVGNCGTKTWSWCESEMGRMIGLINDERTSRGLSALTQDGMLQLLAVEHSKDLACNNLTGHVGSDGRDAQTRIRELGGTYATYTAMAENAGYGHATARSQVDAWMASTGHRDNILNTQVREVGVGCIHIDPRSRYADYWTAVFIAR